MGSPHTSQPSIGSFKDLYDAALKKFDEIFVIAISSKLSGSYNSAVQALEQLSSKDKAKVIIIDSQTASCGTGLLVRELVSYFDKGNSNSEIIEKLEAIKQGINVVAMIDDSIWLQQGGRISPAIGMIINQMKKVNIRPLLGVKEGRIALLKVRTNATDKVKGLWEYLENELGEKKSELIITHADNKEEAELLSNLVRSHKKNCNVLYVNILSPVLGAHIGPGSLIVGWRVLPVK